MQNSYYAFAQALQGEAQWRSELAHCGEMGFDTICLAPPGGDIFRDAFSPDLTLATLVATARQAGLDLMLDLRIDAVAASSALRDGLQLSQTGNRTLDPRIAPADRAMLPIDFTGWDAAADTPGRQWIERLRRRVDELASLGLHGFRCLETGRVPLDAWRSLIEADNRKRGGRAVSFAAWCPSLPPAGQEGSLPFQIAILAMADIFDPATPNALEAFGRAYGKLIIGVEASPGRVPASIAGATAFARRCRSALQLSGAVGDGIWMPAGFEFGQRPPLAGGVSPVVSANTPRLDLTHEVGALTSFVQAHADRPLRGRYRRPALNSSPVEVVARYQNAGYAGTDTIRLVLANRSPDRDANADMRTLALEIGEYLPLQDAFTDEVVSLESGTVALRPGEVRTLEARRSRFIADRRPGADASGAAAASAPRLVIENVSPEIDSGRHPARRIVGDWVRVEADAYGEGHDAIAVALRWREADANEWRECRMEPAGNDRWAAAFQLKRVGGYFFTIEAWRDEFAIFRAQLAKKYEAGVPVSVEIEEGRQLVAATAGKAPDDALAPLLGLERRLTAADEQARLALLMGDDTARIMTAADPRPFRRTLDRERRVESERAIAGFASWYELFPRSQSGDAARHGTFDDVIARLPAIAAMGFDVVYMPPIHPIGRTNRKGRNNTLHAAPDDPGSPYAIGAAEGGHEAVHPQLGTFEDFGRLVAAARDNGLEVALDLAIQASPDHPWIKTHPEWFDWRPDGSIRYAENPPKKYEDIVNVDFYLDGARPSLWAALRDIILLWVERGVKLFRVDNPHTKPFPFWEWVIEQVRRRNPEVVFLSEAFTRPKVMYQLAKIGFSQSYTYFTWRDTKQELRDYFTELSEEPVRQFFRPHLFVNTHDINPDFLQNAPRPAFLIRAALATTLSGLWGMYNGFELCEGRPDAKKKEYADSEKYQLIAWDWSRPGNIVAEITALNRIRRENAALHSHLGVTFHVAWNDNVLYFEKSTAARDNILLVAISLDPHRTQEADIEIPLWEFGLSDSGAIRVEDLMRGHRFEWNGKIQPIRLDPAELPFSIWRLTPPEAH